MTREILVVDDTPANVRLLDAILTAHGYRARGVASGKQALDVVFGETPPDLVLLDIQMAGMDGFEVCRRVRDNEATAMLPVIMVTASGPEEKVAALEAGADDFVSRPFDQAELLARVRSLLRIKEYHDTVVGQAAELAAWNRMLEEQVNEQVEEMQRLHRLRRFLPATVADAVLSTGTEALLQPHRREVALLFCDLRGFSHFASTVEPEDVLTALAGYHGAVGEVVRRYSATVGWFAGDGVMMFFNDPFPCDEPALLAVTAADELHAALGPFVEHWAQRGHELGVGIGVAFGYATLGVIGFEGRYEYTAIGPVVNLAARLCDEAKSGEVLLSQAAVVAVRDRVGVAERGEVLFSGIDEPVPVWRLEGIPEFRAAPPAEAQPAAWLAAASGAPPSIRHGVEFRVLGPVDVWFDGTPLPLRGSKVRALLSLLLLHRGRVASIERLVEELWDGVPPSAATAALRVYVSRLRKLLSAAGYESLLATHPSGYRLDVPDGAIDLARFESLAADARAQLAEGNADRAAGEFRTALALWRGPAFADIAGTQAAAVESARLEEVRLELFEDCIDAELACGRHRRVLSELQAAVAANPVRERLWAQRMTALYRAGRQPEALSAFREYRTYLADELGLDPSREITDLHEAILARSAELDAAR
ncbi:MAG TPA: BTAD domain-containing putative transcriptional regulator [Jatrophihabitantaceae bacterium]|nr:BTAD domain-containing putative transcriptional regulator [Jatrophihabitantaceae bacterium]